MKEISHEEIMTGSELRETIDSIKKDDKFNYAYLIFMEKDTFPYLEIKELCAHFYHLGMHRAISDIEDDE